MTGPPIGAALASFINSTVLVTAATILFDQYNRAQQEKKNKRTFYVENVRAQLQKRFEVTEFSHTRLPLLQRPEILEFQEDMRSSGRAFTLIVGPSRSGKSTTLLEAANGLQGVIYINFRYEGFEYEEADFCSFIGDCFGLGGSQLTEREARKLMSILREVLVAFRAEGRIVPVIIIDDVQKRMKRGEFDAATGNLLECLLQMTVDGLCQVFCVSSTLDVVSALRKLSGFSRLKVRELPYRPLDEVRRYVDDVCKAPRRQAARLPAAQRPLKLDDSEVEDLLDVVGSNLGDLACCLEDVMLERNLYVALDAMVEDAASTLRSAILQPATLQEDWEAWGATTVTILRRLSQPGVDRLLVSDLGQEVMGLDLPPDERADRCLVPRPQFAACVQSLVRQNILLYLDSSRRSLGWHARRFNAAAVRVLTDADVVAYTDVLAHAYPHIETLGAELDCGEDYCTLSPGPEDEEADSEPDEGGDRG
eukprot:tig00001239_g7757.t1